MPLQKIAFFIVSAVALGSAILVITRRNAVHCAMWLVVTLFSVGGIFLTLHAEFLFAVQVILYVGGIMVLFLFVIMLVNLDVAAKQMQFSRQWLLGLATVVVLAAELHLRSEEHTSELQSPCNLVCRLLLEKKKLSGT